MVIISATIPSVDNLDQLGTVLVLLEVSVLADVAPRVIVGNRFINKIVFQDGSADEAIELFVDADQTKEISQMDYYLLIDLENY